MMHHINSSKRFVKQIAPTLAALCVMLVIVAWTAHTVAAAGNQTSNQTQYPTSYPADYQTSASGKTDFGGTVSLVNPLKSDSLEQFLLDLIQILIIFAVPIIILMIIYSGFLYVMARGSEEQVTKATRSFTYAVVGGLLILGAEIILKIIQGTVNQLTNSTL